MIAFGEADPELERGVAVARGRACQTIAFTHVGAQWEFEPPTHDPLVAQELVETLYHLLWELVHVFFEHRGLLEGREARATHDTGASSFLYPFLAEGETDLETVRSDVRRSVVLKAEDVGELRTQTLTEGRDELLAAAATLRDCFAGGGKLLALGNGGSATDAMDLVAHFRASPAQLPRRPAIDLTEDAAILTAIANDIGPEAIFARQVIAYGRPGDALVALSTSGGSANVIAALAEARRRRIHTIAFVGYDGGQIAASALADHVVDHALGAHSADPGGPGSCLPLAARACRAGGAGSRVPSGGMSGPTVVGGPRARVRGRVDGVVQGVGFRPYVYRLADELGLDGFVRNDSRGVVIEVEGDETTVARFLARLPLEAPPLARIETFTHERLAVTRGRVERRGFSIAPSPAARIRTPWCAPTPRPAPTAWPSCSTPATAATAIPFLNCTNCGPRLTIIRGVPYDRPRTTMAAFPMCAAVPRRVRGPARPALPRPAEPPAPLRAAPAALRSRRRAAAGRGRPAAGAGERAAARADRRAQGARRIPPRLSTPATSAPSPNCAAASTATRSRSRSWWRDLEAADALCELGADRAGAARLAARPIVCSAGGRRRRRRRGGVAPDIPGSA